MHTLVDIFKSVATAGRRAAHVQIYSLSKRELHSASARRARLLTTCKLIANNTQFSQKSPASFSNFREISTTVYFNKARYVYETNLVVLISRGYHSLFSDYDPSNTQHVRTIFSYNE